MPISRRTSSILRRSSVNSMPSTITRPRCQSSMRLIQRSSVDLPPPDGPQTTMRSPRMTLRSMSRSTWNVPNHLLRPTISTATSFSVVRMASANPRVDASDRRSWPPSLMFSTRPLGVQSPLHEQRIARHPEADEKIDHAGEHESGEQRHRSGPGRVGKGGTQLSEQVEDRDDQHQRGVLEQRDEGIDHSRYDEAQRLRQDDQSHHAPITRSEERR